MTAKEYHEAGNYPKAWKGFLKAVEYGDGEALFYVGYYHQNGIHVKKHLELALKHFEKGSRKSKYPGFKASRYLLRK